MDGTVLSKEQIKKYRLAYNAQKANAKKRGIEFLLTFDEWLSWWGADITKRGNGACSLQMQRYGDKGPYALGNIKKGYPVDNSATWAARVRNRKAEKAKRQHEAFLDALMWAESREDKEHKEEKDFHYENRPDCVLYRTDQAGWYPKHGD